MATQADADPGEVECPVRGCRLPAVRTVTLHGVWPLECCAAHADEVEADPTVWRLVAGKVGLLVIARAGPDEMAVHRWASDEHREPAS